MSVQDPEPLIPRHGGYRNLKSFRPAQLVYDLTARFCEKFIVPRSRIRDQMVQAARSGVQNIAEGSQASGTSRKMELKLTNVARASLEELRLDYEDFLRQRGLELFPPDHPALKRFKAGRCARLEEVVGWAREEMTRTNTDRGTRTTEHGRTRTNTDEENRKRRGSGSVRVRAGQCRSLPEAELMANAALSLLNLACWLLDRQLAAQAEAFEQEGGFTERLHRVRTERRRGN